ncbi:MAG: helix-turn-helix domain-containing protein [Planctomycetales bacterium]|nr:helix-turn-helix domain-containing protein [Planctomycetales bacterium]
MIPSQPLDRDAIVELLAPKCVLEKLHGIEYAVAKLHEVLRRPEPLVVNRAEAAKRIGVSPTMIDRWRREGRLPSVLIGSERRFRTADIDTFVAGLDEAPADDEGTD